MRKRFLGPAEIVFIVFSLILLSGILIYLNLFMPVSFEDRWKEVRISEGSTYSQGISILKEEGIIKNGFVLLILGRVAMIDRKLRAGYYNFNVSMSPWEVFNRLRKGMIVQYIITIPEGSTLEDVRLKFRGTNLINEDSWQLVKDKTFLESLNIDAPSLEGYLYPDTYNFAKGADLKDIFRMMVHRLRTNFNQSLTMRAIELGMSEREVLTLASIIEKEAMVNRERPLISAVYHNRLKKKIRLQADPTVVYGIKRMQDGITRTDLKRDTPYNTYIIDGLPPGPIASPGIRSIKAALYPADVNYMYFVSKNDGTHHFSRTAKEHMEAVMLYQRKDTKNLEIGKKSESEKTN
jgi:UPF0755 protein